MSNQCEKCNSILADEYEHCCLTCKIEHFLAYYDDGRCTTCDPSVGYTCETCYGFGLLRSAYRTMIAAHPTRGKATDPGA